ncbi:hypothetical protein OE88DRAFT_1656645 [Heliocybe sulcata]|uniref:Uncharacterized protein n=1 Tax=Heliocybe sulcata TaxID=5364 RepID=A0A5C3N921_9AGAM|nr:hypothetical protein OE88DRAFT_1656645 [Heliocybe sulcata]
MVKCMPNPRALFVSEIRLRQQASAKRSKTRSFSMKKRNETGVNPTRERKIPQPVAQVERGPSIPGKSHKPNQKTYFEDDMVDYEEDVEELGDNDTGCNVDVPTLCVSVAEELREALAEIENAEIVANDDSWMVFEFIEGSSRDIMDDDGEEWELIEEGDKSTKKTKRMYSEVLRGDG